MPGLYVLQKSFELLSSQLSFNIQFTVVLEIFQASADLSVALKIHILWLVLNFCSKNIHFVFYTQIMDIIGKL